MRRCAIKRLEEGPYRLKWVDRNKGDQKSPNFRSRLVVREIKKASSPLPEHESFSAMPPLEALKALCSWLVSYKKSRFGRPLRMKILDISRAHFYGTSRRRVFCNLSEGEEIPGKCALKSMYGTMDAASIWQETYTNLLADHDIKAGLAWPLIFYHEASDIIAASYATETTLSSSPTSRVNSLSSLSWPRGSSTGSTDVLVQKPKMAPQWWC